MNNIPPIHTAELLQKYHLRPSKGLGQNFLEDPDVLMNIVKTAEIQPSDSILEIGPGLGSLTRYLAESAKFVTAVELDNHLIPVLKETLQPWSNIKIIHGDILDFSPTNLENPDGYLVVANVPYYITSAIFRHLLESNPRPRRIVLTVQKEIAERICAKPGQMSLLALSIQIYGMPTIAATLPAHAFYPIPKVDSAVIRVDINTQPTLPSEDVKLFFQLAKAGFSQKRKTLRNSLSAGLRLSPIQTENLLNESNINPQRRAETLSIDDWINLINKYKELGL